MSTTLADRSLICFAFKTYLCEIADHCRKSGFIVKPGAIRKTLPKLKSLIYVMILKQKVSKIESNPFQNHTTVFDSNHFHVIWCFDFPEPKLTAAQRIVPEWKDYDAEIKNLMNRVQDQEHEEEVFQPEESIPAETESSSTADDSDDKAKHTEL